MMVATVPGFVAMFRLLRQNRAVQRRHRPGAAVITNFASRRPGAGRPLLANLCAVADADDRWLCLDTAAELVGYYVDFGFVERPDSALGHRVYMERSRLALI